MAIIFSRHSALGSSQQISRAWGLRASLRLSLQKFRSSGQYFPGVTQVTGVATHQDALLDVGTPPKGQLLPGKKSFAEQHWVRGYEVAPNRKLSIVSVGNLLQVCLPFTYAVAASGYSSPFFSGVHVCLISSIFLATSTALRLTAGHQTLITAASSSPILRGPSLLSSTHPCISLMPPCVSSL